MRSWLGRAAFLGRAGWLGLGIALSVALHSSPVLAEGKTVEVASAAEKASAQVKFKAASAHFRAGHWDEAVEGFRGSYEIVRSPNTQVMLGRALRKAGRLVEAYETLERAAEDARALSTRIPKYNQATQTALLELGEIKHDLALVRVEVASADDVALSVAGRHIPSNRWKSIPVLPGKVEIVLKAYDGREARREIDAVADREHPITLELPAVAQAAGAGQPAAPMNPPPILPPPPAKDETADARSGRPLRSFAYVAAGVGAVGLATFAIAGLMARSKERELEDACPENRCPSNLQDEADEGRSEQTVANIGLAVGAIGIATAVALFVADGSGSGAENARRKQKPRPRFELAGSPGSIFVRGAF